PERYVWVIDLPRGVPTKLTFGPGRDSTPVWSPDGSRVVFAHDDENRVFKLYAKASSGAGTDDLLFTGDSNERFAVQDWSLDGRYIIFTRSKPWASITRVRHLWAFPTFGDRKPFALLQSSFNQVHAQLSPDGRWLAYDTNESGMYQVVVQSFPDSAGGKWQVTAAGGVEPRWGRDGRELYYLALDGKLMAVSAKADHPFEAGQPASLFPTTVTVSPTLGAESDDAYQYDVTPDGQRFLLLSYRPAGNSAPTAITTVVNWTAGLHEK